jgi:hypothetical protein
VNLAKVVGAYKYGNCVPVVLQLAGITQAKPGKPFVKMPHGQVLAFNV